MITLGNVRICEDRAWAIKHGGLISFIESDHIEQLVLGHGLGSDFLGGTCVARDGCRFFFGRFRVHVDDKVLGSADTKLPFSVGCGPEVTDEAWAKAVDLGVSAMLGMHGVMHFAKIDVNGSVEDFQRTLVENGPQHGFDVSAAIIEVPDE